MSWRAWLSVVVSGLAVGLVLCGCSPTSGKSWGAGGGSITLTENGSRIAYALERLTRDDEVYLVIAANGCTGVSWSGGEGKFRGQLHAKEGGRIAWSCTTQDGHSGKVIVDGHEFDLAQRALFLVSTRDKPTRVDQIAVDAGATPGMFGRQEIPGAGEERSPNRHLSPVL